jgi:transcriptional regulator with XRE-family HTH domain
MDLREIFILNLKIFRKREGLSQMKLAELCDTASSYIGEIEIGKKFPSLKMIEKISAALRIEPYNLFVNRTGTEVDTALRELYPKLPKPMKDDLADQVNAAMAAILARY